MSEVSVQELVEQATNGAVKDLRDTINRLQRSLATERDKTEAVQVAMYQAIRDGISALEIPDYTPPVKDARRKDEEIAVMMISDLQLGKRTPTYDSDVCEDRIKRLCAKVSKLVEIQRHDHPVKRLAIFFLGDIVEGELIFPGQAHEIDSSLYDQLTINGPRILSGVINWASKEFEQVDVYAVPGNHGSLGGRARRDMHPRSNADRMLYQITAQLTEGLKNVTWDIAEDWWQVADLGENSKFFLLHGEDVRGYAGIPWYGWSRKVMGITSMERIWPEMEFDYMVGGHFHTPVSVYINGKRLWINASTESHNPYAARQLSAAGEPAQWLLFSKPGRGVTAEYLISLSE